MVREDKATCTGCEACAAVCPVDCIRMEPDQEGFAYPVIDEAKCINCGLCVRVCPVDKVPDRPWGKAWAAFAQDAPVREDSSSGGVFTQLALESIARGGMIYGAANFEIMLYAKDGEIMHRRGVEHVGVLDANSLSVLRGSKYAQSRQLFGIFRNMKKELAKRPVLFSGTPCQVAGLYAVLGERHEGALETVDFVCHGVPSPMVYDCYLGELERQKGLEIREVSFRDKSRGWKDFGMRVEFEDGSVYRADQRTDPYLRAFLNNLSLRPSCHQCPFAGTKRQADITLADLWGSGKVTPEMDDDRGLSLALVQPGQGEQMWMRIAPQLVAKEIQAEDTLRDNPCILRPVPPHPNRDAFLRHVRRKGMLQTSRFLKPPSLMRRAWRKGVRILKGQAKD